MEIRILFPGPEPLTQPAHQSFHVAAGLQFGHRPIVSRGILAARINGLDDTQPGRG
jgi:hypothetical protein